MNSQGMFIFQTGIGKCGIAWNERGISRVVLRTKGKGSTVKPPAWIGRVAQRIADHLAGKYDDLCDIELDLSRFTPFTRKVYAALRKVGPGEVTTYGELARKAGSPRAARAVGYAMATNPVPIVIPCHRVVASDGKLGGFSAPGGVRTKRILLDNECA